MILSAFMWQLVHASEYVEIVSLTWSSIITKPLKKRYVWKNVHFWKYLIPIFHKF